MANQPTKYRKFVIGAASAALVASAVAPVASAATKEFSDIKGNTHEGAINALVEAGIINGYADGTFLPNKTLSRSDVVKMMGKWLVAQDYEIPADYNTVQRFDDLPLTANDELLKYAALTHDVGVFKGNNGKLDPAGNITRENMAIVLVRAFDALYETDLVALVASHDFKGSVADKAAAKEEARPYIDVLEFFKITTVTNFDPKATTTRGQFASFLNRTIEASENIPAAPTTDATKVESVSATNLKEIVVEFDGTVDAETAEDEANYSLKSGKTIKSVTLSDDEKTATITLVDKLANNKADAVSISNVKAGDKVVEVKNFEFTTVDNKLPEVLELKSFGTKSVKVTFSEPVDDLKQSNFSLDGKSYFGKVVSGANDRSVILTPYDSNALSVGDHKLTVTGVKDFAGFISLASTHEFTVVEDKDAPTVTEATATLETVTITFSEDVDDETVKASNVYWKSGDSKKEAVRKVQLADNKYKFYFDTDEYLPTGKVDIYVEGVKDYSGNQIAKDSKVTVTPEVDQTRPEVKNATAIASNKIEIQFSKDVLVSSAEVVGNYTVLNKDDKVLAVSDVDVDGDTVTITLYSDLSTGNNTLRVKNVKDKTKLQNTMLDYSATIVKSDKAQPKIDSKVVNEDLRRVVIGFDKKMDISTLATHSNYLVEIDGVLQALNDNLAEISVLQDGKVVVITFTEKIGSKKVQFAAAGDSNQVQVKKLQILGVKDTAGNLLSNFTSNSGNVIDLSTENNAPLSILKATLVDSKTVELKFNAGIVDAPKSAITTLNGKVVDSVEVNGTSTVKVKFTESIGTDVTNATFEVQPTLLDTLAGKGVGVSNLKVGTALSGVAVADEVAPTLAKVDPVTVKGTTGTDAQTLVLTFTEALDDAAFALLPSDLEIKVNGSIIDTNNLTATLAGADDEQIEIFVSGDGLNSSDVTVTLLKDRYVTDVAGNEVTLFTGAKLKSGSALKELDPPTFGATITGTNEITVVFSEKVNKTEAEKVANYTYTTAAPAVEAVVSATLQADGKTVKIVTTTAPTTGAKIDAAVKDLAGNTSATAVITFP